MKPGPSFPFAAAASVEVALNADQGGAPARRVQLLPIGDVVLRDGRGLFRLPADQAAAVVAATRAKAGRTAMMVDYDHQSVFAARDGVGGQAPAAGWIDPATITVDATGIWADVEWTAAAADRLRAREYRYLSPLFTYDEKTRIVSSILNAGLTNSPAIEALAAVAAAQPTTHQTAIIQETQMNYAKIAAALGLADTATEDEVMAKIASLTESMAGMASAATVAASVVAAAEKLGLAKDAGVEQIVAAAAQVDPAEFVPVASLNDIIAQLAEMQGERADKAVAAATEAGKLAPSLKSWALRLAKKSLPEFNDWVAKAPVVVEPGEALAAASVQAGSDGLTESERSVAKMLGRTPEQFLAAKKA